jgi:pimeloyl-ACP methyl ester carboxylesterase
MAGLRQRARLTAVTIVLVHGNPESEAIWGPLRAELGRDDVVALSPPGFGGPVPVGFTATVEAYRDWLGEQLVGLGGPVDLVGHDWGGGHVINLAMTRPDLLRSWTSDIIGVYDPEYVFHDLAQTWQTPEAGEKLVDSMMGGTAESRAERMLGYGFPADIAAEVARVQGPDMGRCILALYRSAAQPAMAELGQSLPAAAARPGLALSATEDHAVGSMDSRRRAAALAGAELAELPGLGHWWMLQDPVKAAEVLTRFWDSLRE